MCAGLWFWTLGLELQVSKSQTRSYRSTPSHVHAFCLVRGAPQLGDLILGGAKRNTTVKNRTSTEPVLNFVMTSCVINQPLKLSSISRFYVVTLRYPSVDHTLCFQCIIMDAWLQKQCCTCYPMDIIHLLNGSYPWHHADFNPIDFSLPIL